jgi:hypothetical protein
MGLRRVMAFIIIAAAVHGCTSPGTAYGYLDVLVQPSAYSSVVQPSTSQAFVITFPVRNTHNQALTVAYDIHENVIADPIAPTSGPVAAGGSGSVTVPAFGTVNVALAIPAKAAGSYAWSIVLDPGGLISERNETNNTATLRVEVADFDVSFGAPAPQVTVPPATGDLTIDFAITNTNNAAAAAPTSADVNVAITIDGAGAVTVTSISSGSPLGPPGPLPITVGAGVTVPVSITVQRPAVGNHTYTIVLTPTVADSNVPNNTALVVTPSVN